MHVGEPRRVACYVDEHGQQLEESDHKAAQVQIASVGCGIRHTAAVSVEGKLFTFGHNMCGQLGHGDRTECPIPRLVKIASDLEAQGSPSASTKDDCAAVLEVLGVSCGGYHTIATVAVANDPVRYQHYAWGYGEEGQLGLADPPAHSVLVPQPLPEPIA